MSLRPLLHRLPRRHALSSPPISLFPLLNGRSNAIRVSLRGFRTTPNVTARYLRFNPPSREDVFKFQKWDTGTKIIVVALAGATGYYLYQ